MPPSPSPKISAADLKELKDSLIAEIRNPLMEEMAALKTALSKKDQMIAALQSKVLELEERADDLEQYTRRNSLRVQGLSETEGEEDPIEKTLEFANRTLQLNPPLLPSDIDRAHRTGRSTPGQPRAFLVKFATYQQRRRVMMNKHRLRNTSIFINEDLTAARATLMWHARKAKREGKLSDCWSSDGRIFVKKTGSGDKALIRRQDDLEKLLASAQDSL